MFVTNPACRPCVLPAPHGPGCLTGGLDSVSQHLDSLRDSSLPRLLALRILDPADVLAAVREREAVEGRARRRVERCLQIGGNLDRALLLVTLEVDRQLVADLDARRLAHLAVEPEVVPAAVDGDRAPEGVPVPRRLDPRPRLAEQPADVQRHLDDRARAPRLERRLEPRHPSAMIARWSFH